MRDRIPAPLRRVGGIFGSFTTGQKAVTILGVVALIVGGIFFASWASKPAMAPLFNNLSGQDASKIVENLTSSGVAYELSDGGKTINVPSDKVYELRLQMSGEGLPAEAETGYALLDKQGVTASDFMQHVGYQRALEGELAKTIKSIEGVQAATVHLVLPQKDIFSDDEKKTTASVMITSKSGVSLDDEQVRAVVHLVASSVEGLDPKNVTVTDQAGTVLSTGDGRGTAGAGSGSGGGDQRSRATAAFDTQMNIAVQKMLENVVGPGKAMVKTTSDLDFDETSTKSQRYVADPAVPPLTETTKNEKFTGSGSGNGGVLGPDNIQVPAGNGANNYTSTEEARRNAVGVVEETRKSAPGAVRRLSVSVLLDQNAAAGVNQAQIQQLVSAAVGLNPQRGDTMAVSVLPFSTADTGTVKADADKAAAAERNAELMNYAKTGGLILIVLILILLAWLSSRKKRKQLSEEELAELAEMQAALLAEADAARAIEGGSDAPALESGEDGPNRREEISEMVANQPEEVAVLLRSWLADRRG